MDILKRRNEIIAWADLARQAKDDPCKKLLCPNDGEVLKIKVINYPEHSKIEVLLKCPKCKIERITTFNQDDNPSMKVND